MNLLDHRMDLTPRELFAGFRFIKSGPARALSVEVLPFTCPKKPLEGTTFQFQLAISDRSVAENIQAIRKGQPELPRSGDRRSGVIVFDGNRIIGSLIVPGNLSTQGYKMTVVPEHRQNGLAHKMLVEWCWSTKRVRVLPHQGITVNATKALLSAHKAIVERALSLGMPVSDRVRTAVQSGIEAQEIIKEAMLIESLVRPPRRRTRAKVEELNHGC